MAKPTVHDIAKEAGVSLATVDRVMNARPGVREKTVEKVQSAIARLGYVRDISAANLAKSREYKFAFVLPDRPSQFLSSLRHAIEEVGHAVLLERSQIEMFSVPHIDENALAHIADTLITQRFDGAAIMASESADAAAFIARLKSAGLAVASLVTDQTDTARKHFVGIDNTSAGRSAGLIMGRFLPQSPAHVVTVVNSMAARDMIERVNGFSDVLKTSFPHFNVLPPLEAHDDLAMAAQVLGDQLDQGQPIAGVYNAGAGTRGITQALRDRKLDQNTVVIAHELTEHARSALSDGTIDAVITQNVGHLARSALRVLRAYVDGRDIVPSQEKIRIEIVLKENLP